MRKILLILGLLSSPYIHATSALRCVTDTLYQEARGTATEEMVMVGNTILNWHKRTRLPICKIVRKGYTQRTPPHSVRGVYESIAKGLLSGKIKDLTNGADHFNEGRRPAFKGRIKRCTAHFVFYRLHSSR